MSPKPSLDGQVAVVTGGGRGIGRASALGLAAAGAAVVVSARSNDQIRMVAKEIEASGGRAIPVTCDVTEYDECRALISRAVNELGRLDILLNNAGGGLTSGKLADCPPQEWAETVTLNLTGTFNCCHAALPHMNENGGKVLNVGSGAGHSAQKGVSAYGAAKAGVTLLTRSLAQETWRHGIDVNEVIPGPVETEFTKENFGSGDVPFAPSERVKQPEEVAELIVWLATQPSGGGLLVRHSAWPGGPYDELQGGRAAPPSH